MGISTAGPDWTLPGLDLARGRYPLRVEAHSGRMVDALLPGVITTTYHPRSFALHALAWTEAHRRQLDRDEAEAFVRRCEVVLAGIWLAHDPHRRSVSRAHGADAIAAQGEAGEVLDLARLAEPGVYAQGRRGFAGVYYASEVQLGLLSHGWPPRPHPELDPAPLQDTLGPILELARRDDLSVEELSRFGDLCVCGTAEGADGELLRQVLARRIRAGRDGDLDRARIATVGMVVALVRSGAEGSLEDHFRRRYGQGPLGAGGFHRAAWQGTILRSYAVGAWRRLWSWIVACLSERRSLAEVAEMLAEQVSCGTVGELFDRLPETEAEGSVLAVEEELRGDGSLNPDTDLQLLALSALRFSSIGAGAVLTAFAGDAGEDDLGPAWTSRWLQSRRSQPLSVFAQELVELLVARAERIALEKMEIRRGKAWIPIRIAERDGLYWATDREPHDDVTFRIGALGSVLHELGILERDGERWHVTDRGESYATA